MFGILKSFTAEDIVHMSRIVIMQACLFDFYRQAWDWCMSNGETVAIAVCDIC